MKRFAPPARCGPSAAMTCCNASTSRIEDMAVTRRDIGSRWSGWCRASVVVVVAIVVAAGASCGLDATDQRAPNPPHGMPGHDHSQMHTPAPDRETERSLP